MFIRVPIFVVMLSAIMLYAADRMIFYFILFFFFKAKEDEKKRQLKYGHATDFSRDNISSKDRNDRMSTATSLRPRPQVIVASICEFQNVLYYAVNK